MEMTDSEIKRSYREAKYPITQIRVLADLNGVSATKIRTILGLKLNNKSKGAVHDIVPHEGCLSCKSGIFEYDGVVNMGTQRLNLNDVLHFMDSKYAAVVYLHDTQKDAKGSCINAMGYKQRGTATGYFVYCTHQKTILIREVV